MPSEEPNRKSWLYCGVVKLHKVDATLGRKAVEAKHVTRQRFGELFETIYGKKVRASISKKLEDASKIRDKVLHGKKTTPKELRTAVVEVIDYASEFNNLLSQSQVFALSESLRDSKDAASHSNVQRADGCCAELASMSFEQSNKRLQSTPKKAVRFWVP